MTGSQRNHEASARAGAFRARLLFAGLAALLLLALGTVARAQDPPPALPDDPSDQGALAEGLQSDPGEACQQEVDENGLGSTTQGAGCDNPYTPIGKDGKGIGWTQWAGAIHPDAQKPSGYDSTVQNVRAAIPPTVDFYTVRFANSKNGFAGGAQCREDAPAKQADESEAAYQKRITPFLNTCERVPVIYRYTENSELGPIWQQDYKGNTPGFVGAITWLHNTDTREHGQRALAVGGTGSPNANCPKSETDPPYPKESNPSCGGYPRREPAIPDSACPLNPNEIKAADVDPDGKKPEVKQLPGVLFPQVDPSQSVVTGRDLREAQARCEEKWRQDHDAAGKGRAWLFSDGDWQDLGTPGEGLPRGMRGMTAVDAALDTSQCGGDPSECAMAGGLQQIWMWTADGFDRHPWAPDPPADAPPSRKVSPVSCAGDSSNIPRAANCKRWHFRIRAVRFVYEPVNGTTSVTAVTGGCCSTFPDSSDLAREGSEAGASAGSPPPETLTLSYSKTGTTWAPQQSQPRGLADSIYALAATAFGQLSYLSTPGGPQRPNEPRPQIMGTDGTIFAVPGHFASSARLVTGDGNSQGHQVGVDRRLAGGASDGDSSMDWAAGGFKGTQRGLAYTTTTEADVNAHGVMVFPLECPAGFLDGNSFSTVNTAPTSAPKCTPKEQAKMAEETRSGYLFKLSSYFLNGFGFAADSGIGWGVGDRGAIDRLAGNDASSGGTLRPDNAPQLGPKRAGSAPASEPYRSTAPKLSNAPGTVPGRAVGEPQDLPEPRATSYGSPKPQGYDGEIDQIVMSRDGTEGWAIGPLSFSTRMPLYRFDAGQWRTCGTDSVEGVIRADPACEALRPLMHDPGGVRLTAIARIPMEYGSDPTKADDFEAIATASNGKILHYRDGRWAVNEAWTEQLNLISHQVVTDVAFSSPNDGWALARFQSTMELFHFDGTAWTKCGEGMGGGFASVEPDECRDHDHLLPVNPNDGGMHVTSAGDRAYFYANRSDTNRQSGAGGSQSGAVANLYPLILYKDPGPCEKAGDPGCWQQAYDPGCLRQEPDPANPSKFRCIPDEDRVKRGRIHSLSVAVGPDGSYNGWGLGHFRANSSLAGTGNTGLLQGSLSRGATETPLIRSNSENGKSWAPVQGDTGANHALLPETTEQGSESNPGFIPESSRIIALPAAGGKGMVVAATSNVRTPAVWLNPSDGRWRVAAVPWCTNAWVKCPAPDEASREAMAPDNAGGVWMVAHTGYASSSGNEEDIFYRFSSHAPREVFTEAPHPIREMVSANAPIYGGDRRYAATGATGGGDGSFWVATDGNVVYRYDRQTGWDRMTVPGWDPGRFVTNPSPAYAIAIGADGSGVVVGKQGRIANVGPEGAVLDRAAGVLCSKNPPPCGTGRDLRAASVAPDGSAMVGGDTRALLYRERATGQFHTINPPPVALFANITGVSLPRPDQAWVTTNLGEIWAGTFDGSEWTWEREDADEFGDSLSRDTTRRNRPLWAIAIDASGHGYAVGENGTIIERTGDGGQPWRRVDAGILDELHSVTLGPGGKGALIGGDGGLILTETTPGRFVPARFADRYDPTNKGPWTWISRVSGVALLAGPKEGQVEAWAASQTPGAYRPPVPTILHHSNDPSEPLLDGVAKGTEDLGDSPPRTADRLSFAAFGNSACQDKRQGLGATTPFGTAQPCMQLTGNNKAHERVALRVRDELLARDDDAAAPDFNLFTGDVGSLAGTHRNVLLGTPFTESAIHDRWREFVADPLAEAGLPVFGAIGPRDLGTTASTCQPHINQQYCYSADATQSGLSTGWRRSMAGMPAPWGARGAPPAKSSAGLSFEPVDTGGTKKEMEDTPIEDPTKETLGGKTIEDPTKAAGGQTVEDPTGGPDRQVTSDDGAVGDTKIPESGAVGDQTLPTGGAHTHYALDVKRDGKALMRLVVLDTSLKSLAASNHNQNPVEEQLGWLKDALQRPEGQRAVVLTSTPTYSYGPGAGTDTVTEGTVLESILMENKVDLVVDGRLGWNALYYALAPGVHWPCPGDSYKTEAPPSVPDCQGVGSSEADKAVTEAQKSVAEIGGDAAGARALPFLIAHSAGGRYGPDGEADGTGHEGYWRGYSVAHLDTKTGQIQIEQRPVFDWIGIRPESSRSATHALRPGQKIPLEGFGREVLGIDTGPRYKEITGPAITHCFDLVLADQEKPWLPLKAEDAEDEQLAAQGDGCANREPAGAQLTAQREEASNEAGPCAPYVCMPGSVGTIHDQSGEVRAGKGERGRTFGIAVLSVGDKVATYPLVFEPRPSFTPPRIPPLPPQPPPAPPAPPANPPLGTVGNLSLPTPPALPSLPLGAELVPPAPPIPPPPPGAANVAPLNLFLSTPGINIAPQSTVVPPPAPPIQPAPPGGARKEARQRQAAAQKSGSEAAPEDQQFDSADQPNAPTGADMTRYENNFTAAVHREQPSAWARNLQWGGGMTLMALVLAFGWTTIRPTPRRTPPHVPAPAWSRSDYRRRRR